MCGIFGAIGHSINPGIIRALAIVNRERGTDSLGFFSNTGKFVKRAGDPIGCLGDEDFAEFIDNSCNKGWFIAGHTRQATHGTICSKNSHPFRYGRIIGSHNGIVQTPRECAYRVDSEFLIDRLNAKLGDYQTAFADIAGYWALSWFDGESFYLQAHKNEIAIGCDEFGVWYYSSDWQHLEAAARIVDNFDLIANGETICFNIKCKKFHRMPAFKSAIIPAVSVIKSYPSVPQTARGRRKERRKLRKQNKTEFALKAENTDPFYYDDCEGGSSFNERDVCGVPDAWEDYVKEFN